MVEDAHGPLESTDDGVTAHDRIGQIAARDVRACPDDRVGVSGLGSGVSSDHLPVAADFRYPGD